MVIGYAKVPGADNGCLLIDASARVLVRGREVEATMAPVVRNGEGVVAISIDEDLLDVDTILACAGGHLRALAEVGAVHGVPVVNEVKLIASIDGGTTWLDDHTGELSGENHRWMRAIATDKARGNVPAPRIKAHVRSAGFKEARIDLKGPITSKTAEKLLPAIEAAGDATIVLNINSLGGLVRPARQIYDALLAHQHLVRVQIEGEAASAASLLAMAGDIRKIDKAARMMIHQPYVDVRHVNAKNVGSFGRMLNRSADHFSGCYAARTGRSIATVKRWLEKETYFSAIDSVKLGLAHEVTTRGVTMLTAADLCGSGGCS